MLNITAQNDFTDVSVRRLLGILNEKKISIDGAIAMISGVDPSTPLRQLVQSVPGLDGHLQYILGPNWMSQARGEL